jgi:hypothetical protein
MCSLLTNPATMAWGDTRMHDDDRDDNSIDEVIVVDPPPVVVDPPPVYCQITLHSPPPVDNDNPNNGK